MGTTCVVLPSDTNCGDLMKHYDKDEMSEEEEIEQLNRLQNEEEFEPYEMNTSMLFISTVLLGILTGCTILLIMDAAV